MSKRKWHTLALQDCAWAMQCGDHTCTHISPQTGVDSGQKTTKAEDICTMYCTSTHTYAYTHVHTHTHAHIQPHHWWVKRRLPKLNRLAHFTNTKLIHKDTDRGCDAMNFIFCFGVRSPWRITPITHRNSSLSTSRTGKYKLSLSLDACIWSQYGVALVLPYSVNSNFHASLQTSDWCRSLHNCTTSSLSPKKRAKSHDRLEQPKGFWLCLGTSGVES